MTPAEYLKRPYERLLFPEQDGSWSAEILEFRGCFATGDTAAEALQNLERVAESWILGMIAKGESIPPYFIRAKNWQYPITQPEVKP